MSDLIERLDEASSYSDVIGRVGVRLITEARDDLRQQADELERLLTIIEAAPHAEACGEEWHGVPVGCDCWKSKVQPGEGGHG